MVRYILHNTCNFWNTAHPVHICRRRAGSGQDGELSRFAAVPHLQFVYGRTVSFYFTYVHLAHKSGTVDAIQQFSVLLNNFNKTTDFPINKQTGAGISIQPCRTGCRQMTRAGHTPDVECCKAVMRSLGAAGEWCHDSGCPTDQRQKKQRYVLSENIATLRNLAKNCKRNQSMALWFIGPQTAANIRKDFGSWSDIWIWS